MPSAPRFSYAPNGSCLVAADNWEIYAYDGKDDSCLWIAQMDATVVAVKALNEVVLGLDINGKLVAYAIADGSELWSFESGERGLCLAAHPSGPWAIVNPEEVIWGEEGREEGRWQELKRFQRHFRPRTPLPQLRKPRPSTAWPQSQNLPGPQPRLNSPKFLQVGLDTCSDSDCNGCCSENATGVDALIDLENYTDACWGLPDGELQWADVGPRSGPVSN